MPETAVKQQTTNEAIRDANGNQKTEARFYDNWGTPPEKVIDQDSENGIIVKSAEFSTTSAKSTHYQPAVNMPQLQQETKKDIDIERIRLHIEERLQKRAKDDYLTLEIVEMPFINDVDAETTKLQLAEKIDLIENEIKADRKGFLDAVSSWFRSNATLEEARSFLINAQFRQTLLEEEKNEKLVSENLRITKDIYIELQRWENNTSKTEPIGKVIKLNKKDSDSPHVLVLNKIIDLTKIYVSPSILNFMRKFDFILIKKESENPKEKQITHLTTNA